jgi:sugar-specific transcriptional regulator TrmB
MDKLISELKHLGLSEKESAVYLAALELGPTPVQDISHKAKVNRATTYVMIESLSSRGLMSTFVKGKKRFYVAESPERLSSILNVQKKEIQEKQDELIKTLPMLLALYNAEGAKPQIRYLEGREGIATTRSIFEGLDGEFLQILPVDDAMSATDIKEGQKEHMSRLDKIKTPHRVLAVSDNVKETHSGRAGVGEHRYISSKDFPMHGEITIRGNHVFLFSYKSTVLSIVIVSQEISEAMRALFNLAWKGAEGAPQKNHE